MTEDNLKDLKLKDILQWMLNNKDDYDAMDDINRTSFAYMKGIRGREQQW